MNKFSSSLFHKETNILLHLKWSSFDNIHQKRLERFIQEWREGIFPLHSGQICLIIKHKTWIHLPMPKNTTRDPWNAWWTKKKIINKVY